MCNLEVYARRAGDNTRVFLGDKIAETVLQIGVGTFQSFICPKTNSVVAV
jgi:hypothetical protein